MPEQNKVSDESAYLTLMRNLGGDSPDGEEDAELLQAFDSVDDLVNLLDGKTGPLSKATLRRISK
jgi:hypothetical protein